MLAVRSLSGGSLAEVMRACMIPSELHEPFTAGIKPVKDGWVDSWVRVCGWQPPAECAEWKSVVSSYRQLRYEVSDTWLLDRLPRIRSIEKQLGKPDGVNRPSLISLLVTGLTWLGRDPSGDSCMASTLPNPAGTASVHVYDHECGELDGPHFGSIAAFIAHFFSPEESDEHDHAVRSYQSAVEKTWWDRPVEADSVALFQRSQWLDGLVAGKLPYGFASHLATAPDFEAWEAEKTRIPATPVLANYWLLAHLFLGNTDALAEAIELAANTPGLATATVREAVAQVLPTGRFGTLKAAALAKVREATATNCPPGLLEPARRERALVERSAGIALLTEEEQQRRLAAGESVADLVRAFPDDVAAHDRLLAIEAAGDDDRAKLVRAYVSARGADYYHQWPESWDEVVLPAHWSTVASAAFRAGLRFDVDHPESNQGLTQTLLHFDDDAALAAWSEAVDRLAVADSRVGYVIADLDRSRHPRAPELLERAAMRFFALRDEARARRTEKVAEGPTLDNLFSVDSEFLAAVKLALRRGGEAATRVADRTLERPDGLSLLGSALGLAFRVAGEQGLDRHLDFVYSYLMMADERLGHDSTERLVDDAVVVNLTEAAAALVDLGGADAAGPVLREVFARERVSRLVRLDVRGALLAGLLPLGPDPELLAFTERVLGNRGGAMRVYGALRGVERAGLGEAAEWVRPHVYLERVSLSDESLVRDAARATMTALGVEVPVPDETDRYALKVPSHQLPDALLQPHRHQTHAVLERIVKKGVTSGRVIDLCERVLTDVLRYSTDDPPQSSNQVRGAGVRALFAQGPAAVDSFARLAALPHLAQHETGMLLLMMRLVGQEASVRRWLRSAGRDELFAELAQPQPRSQGWLDLLAANALVRFGDNAHDPVISALRWRWARVGTNSVGSAGCNDREPQVYRLSRLVASMGDRGRGILAEVRAGATGHTLSRILDLSPRPTSAAPIEVRPGRTVTLSDSLDPQRSGPHFTLAVNVDADNVNWCSEVTHLHVEDGVLPNGKHTEKDTMSFDSPEAALAWAREAVDEARLLGYRRAG